MALTGTCQTRAAVGAVITSPAWQQQKAVAAVEGIVAIAYERQQGEHSRIYQVGSSIRNAGRGPVPCKEAGRQGARASPGLVGSTAPNGPFASIAPCRCSACSYQCLHCNLQLAQQ